MSQLKKIVYCFGTVCLAGLMACSTTGKVAQRDQLSARVGDFSPPPSGLQRKRVGVPPFTTETDLMGYSVTGNELASMASDQMSTLLFRSRRFDVIERAQLNQLLREQNLEGIVKGSELAQMSQVRGVDFLLLGKITNFRITQEQQSDSFGVGGRISRELLDGIAGSVRRDQQRITTEVGVDIRLVDPSTGMVKMAEFSEFVRTDTAGGFGIRVAGIGGGGNAKTQISADDAGQVLRLAFDDALRKAMPDIDRMLMEEARNNPASNVSPAPASGTAPAQGAAFCGNCGEKVAAGAKFCASCGQKVSSN